MRLHRLELTAFGPFAGTQSVDFDELSAAGLFLLHGPTGAGKTSVLDAVCYALYGQVPGVRPATRLRSDHAAPGTSTEVVLELTLGERRLEITRRPEQPRAKKRGSGTTMDKAVTLLREHTGGQWRGLSKSHQEAGEEIRQLVGMSREQFCQVVLLPQGEFATFLRAGAVERAALLGRLFDTRRFKAVEHRLRDLRHEAAQRLASGDEELRQLTARIRQAAAGADLALDPDLDRDLDFGDAEPDDAARLLAEAAILRCGARELHDITRATLAGAEHVHTAAAVEATTARDLYALQRRHRDALDRAAAVAREEPARTAARARLARARRALAVEPALALRDKAAAQHADTRSAEAAALAELDRAGELALPAGAVPRARTAPAANGTPSSSRTGGPGSGPAQDREPRDDAPAGTEADERRDVSRTVAVAAGDRSWDRSGDQAEDRAPGADQLARRAGELREEVGGLAAAGAAEAQVREIRERLHALERDERGDEEAVREAQAWLERWPRTRRALQARVDAGGEAATRAAELAGQVESARRRRDAAVERDRLAGELIRAEDAARDVRDRVADARQAWQDLREARISGMAAELAARLVDGEPCRVCGAPDHPDPARATDHHVTRADEEAAATAYQRQQAAHDRARDEAARLRAALEAATATSGDDPQAELATACAALAAKHAEAARAAADVPEARGTLARAEEERDRRTAQRQEALNRTAARASRREELDAQHGRLTAELERVRAGHATVEARRERLMARIAVLDRAVHTVREAAEAAHRCEEAEAELAQAADGAGFASAREAAAALLRSAELRDAEGRVAGWAKEEATIEADLAAPEPAAAATREAADPAAAQQALDDAHERLRAASSAESAAATRVRELDELAARATARVRELAPERVEFARLKRLADLTSANSTENQYRMELETYVLAARLEQVAAAAGVRLQRMSAGRYTLVHSDARGGGRAKSGLGLMVVDAWTGTERDTATLSGGETFFASLALALGLADVVTDEAGGARLDTLFIDEGFGSLDEQTLDEVLDVLDGLRERDRAVGIVSHVADLRHRIPAQLRVVKGRDGSHVRLRTGSTARD